MKINSNVLYISSINICEQPQKIQYQSGSYSNVLQNVLIQLIRSRSKVFRKSCDHTLPIRLCEHIPNCIQVAPGQLLMRTTKFQNMAGLWEQTCATWVASLNKNNVFSRLKSGPSNLRGHKTITGRESRKVLIYTQKYLLFK